MPTQTAFLSLQDFAKKYEISVSTLRRRIKKGQLKYQLDDGKYYVADEEPEFYREMKSAKSSKKTAKKDDSIELLVAELKKAYTFVLHEKEEQIRYFQNEIADLKTLVRVLEQENERLKKS